jgi:hypothetical protein
MAEDEILEDMAYRAWACLANAVPSERSSIRADLADGNAEAWDILKSKIQSFCCQSIMREENKKLEYMTDAELASAACPFTVHNPQWTQSWTDMIQRERSQRAAADADVAAFRTALGGMKTVRDVMAYLEANPEFKVLLSRVMQTVNPLDAKWSRKFHIMEKRIPTKEKEELLDRVATICKDVIAVTKLVHRFMQDDSATPDEIQRLSHAFDATNASDFYDAARKGFDACVTLFKCTTERVVFMFDRMHALAQGLPEPCAEKIMNGIVFGMLLKSLIEDHRANEVLDAVVQNTRMRQEAVEDLLPSILHAVTLTKDEWASYLRDTEWKTTPMQAAVKSCVPDKRRRTE